MSCTYLVCQRDETITKWICNSFELFKQTISWQNKKRKRKRQTSVYKDQIRNPHIEQHELHPKYDSLPFFKIYLVF